MGVDVADLLRKFKWKLELDNNKGISYVYKQIFYTLLLHTLEFIIEPFLFKTDLEKHSLLSCSSLVYFCTLGQVFCDGFSDQEAALMVLITAFLNC